MADYPALDLQFLDAPGPDAFLRERLYALLDDFEPTAIHEDDSGDAWRVFFRSPQRRDDAAAHLATAVSAHLLRTAVLDVPDEDWARRSQQDLKAVEVGRLIVAPPWDVRKADVPVIVIEPSTGFGTGHHATTRLCLRLLQTLELRGSRVLDIGTGSGVLALAAWKLGAAEVVAIDNDPDALDNARANIARNGAAGTIDIVCDDVSTLRIEGGDVVVANLTVGALVRHATALRALVRAEGYLILSGFARDHLVEIVPAFAGVEPIDDVDEADWHAALLRC